MAEQELDLRGTMSILRRRRLVLAGAAVAGAACGVGLALLSLAGAAVYSSTSQVLLPPMQQETVGAQRDVGTEVSIAESDVVLGAAGRELGLSMPLRALKRRVDVTALSDDVLEITGRGESPERAQALARAVAEAEVAYVEDAASSLSNAQRAALEGRERALEESMDTVAAEIAGTRRRLSGGDPTSVAGKADAAALAQLTAEQANLVLRLDEVKHERLGEAGGRGASVIQPAEPGRRPGVVRESGVAALLGSTAMVFLVACGVVLLARRDRRLRLRDEIADALGSPVIGSLRSRAARTPAAWSELLTDYEPGRVDAWTLRQVLRQLHAMEGPDAPDVDLTPIVHPTSVTVMALADDARGMALGPQLAAYAAGTGVRTRLATVHRHESAAALWAAFSTASDTGQAAPDLWVGTEAEDADIAFTVVLLVIDENTAELTDLPATAVDLLAVTAGVSTAEELARVAVLADDARHRIDAVLVADPDPLDQTTGRMLQRERARQVPLPARTTGTTPPGIGTVSALRRRRP
ncbi:MAG: hypothetical protein LT071_05470 [Nocardioides sp.]|nr:hypothetical protein [Nocardioides sp.]